MRPISPPPTSNRPGARAAFTLIEAVVALVVTAFVATAVARISMAALERERKAAADAETARAVRALTALLAEADPAAGLERNLPDGWRAVRRDEKDESAEWQSWELFAPGSVRADHVVHLPAPAPRREAPPGRTAGAPAGAAP